MKKYSVSLHGHATSVSLEPEFWQVLQKMAQDNDLSVPQLISVIDDHRIHQPALGLSAAIRVFILEHLRAKLETEHKPYRLSIPL